MTMNEQPVRTEVEGPVGWVVLDRPDRRNALSVETFTALSAAFSRLDADPNVRAIIVRGEGKAFCAGIDLTALDALLQEGGADSRELLRKKILELQDCIGAPERIEKPVIAAAHGFSFGAGVDLLCACDIRMATADATFGVRETKVAMVADVGTLQRLPSIIGQGWFRELALTGRNFGAEEALRMGFVTRVCADRTTLYAEARALAEEIAANSPLAVQGVKDVALFSRDHGVQAGLRYVAQKSAGLLYCEDVREALLAIREGRPARFRGK
jgi:enoyl-CoA hydratase